MTTLYIDRRNLRLSINGDALVIHENNQHVNTIPLKILQRICIHGDTTLSAKVLGKLGEEGIGVLILSGRQQHPTLLMPNWKLDGKRRQMQYAQSQNLPFCLQIAQNLITEKISKQHSLLISYAAKKPHIQPHINTIHEIKQQIPSSLDISTLRGLEGAAAAQYFSAWQKFLPSSLNFTGRNRRPPRDPVNSLLSLGYTLLHFEIVKHIHLCGLDPYIGYYHTPEHGRESLACDLLEPLRPQYDQWLLKHFHHQIFRAQDFSTNAQGCTINKAGRLRFYQHYEQLAKTWRPTIHQHCHQLLNRLQPNDPDFQAATLTTIANSKESTTE